MKCNRTPHKMGPQLVVGVFIILLGVTFLLDHLGVLEAGSLLQYWPVLLIAYGIGRLSQGREGRGWVPGAFFILVGSVLLLNELHFIDVNIWAFWPLILVLVGGLLVWRAMGKRRHAGHGDPDAVASESVVNTFTMFGGVGRRNASQDFKGGEITTILGGCELDLRGASIKNGPAVIDVFVFWGGIDIKVPEDWTVSIETMPLMGGCDDKTRPAKNGSGKHLVIKGYIIMGGLEIG